jgi:hypothetical protein
MLGYDKLMNFYKTNFALVQHHKYSLSDIENMLPWERMIYINLLKGYLKDQEETARDQAASNRANMRRR